MPLTALILPTLVMAAILVLPGAAVSLALGLRGGLALATAFPASVALIATAGMLTGLVPLSWGVLPVALVAVCGIVIAAGIRFLHLRFLPGHRYHRGDWASAREWSTYAGVALAAGAVSFALFRGIGSPDLFSQTYDNYFHMALIRSVLETGEASAFVPLDFANPDGDRFLYPNAWHQLASLLMTTGATSSIAVAQNALTVVVAGLVWPSSVMFMIRSVARGTPLLLVGTGVVSAALPAFPYLLVGYGVLYPLLLGIALLPVGVGLVIQALRLGDGERLALSTLLALCALFVGATSIAHPNALLGWVAISFALVLTFAIRAYWRVWRTEGNRHRVARATLMVVVVTLATALLWVAVRPGPFWWPALATGPQALGEFLMGAPLGRSGAIAVFLLVVLGLVVMSRRPVQLLLAAPAGIMLLLWVIAASSTDEVLRDFFVGGFYNDPHRVAALLPVALILLTVPALRAVEERSGLESRPRSQRLASLAGSMILLLLATQADRPIREEMSTVSGTFERNPGSQNVTPDEYQMIRDLPQFVSEEDLVVGDPKTGMALIFALEGLHPIQYHPNDHPSFAERVLLYGLSNPAAEARVCDAVRETGADWVLDFGTNQVNMDLVHNPPQGLKDLDESPLVTLTHQVGDTRLFEITGCAGTS